MPYPLDVHFFVFDSGKHSWCEKLALIIRLFHRFGQLLMGLFLVYFFSVQSE